MLSLVASPAYAQRADSVAAEGPPASRTVFDGDYLAVGIGAGYGPSYAGSDDYVAFPAGVVLGSVSGIDFRTRGMVLDVDLVTDPSDAKLHWTFGPSLSLRRDRSGQIKDAVVKRLGTLDSAIELGAVAGVQVNRLLNPYDSITLDVEARWDIAGAHGGRIITPGLSYFTPLSRGTAFTLSLYANHVSDSYADYYYTVDATGSAASGLPVFSGKGGLRGAGANMLIAQDVDGNIADGGLGVFALGGYSRLLGDAGRTPITSLRGDADQWIVVAGVGYTF